MKIRTGHVSNSSSSSFVVNVSDLSYRNVQDLLDYPYWDIEISEDMQVISGCTIMDNGELEEYCKEKNIPRDVFQWCDQS